MRTTSSSSRRGGGLPARGAMYVGGPQVNKFEEIHVTDQ